MHLDDVPLLLPLLPHVVAVAVVAVVAVSQVASRIQRNAAAHLTSPFKPHTTRPRDTETPSNQPQRRSRAHHLPGAYTIDPGFRVFLRSDRIQTARR